MNSNPFRGVNPHLNSLLQTPGGEERSSLWPTFHSTHINHLADFLNQQLPLHYTAYSEQSLQVRGVEWGDELIVRRPRPDVTVFRQSVGPPSSVSSVLASPPTWEAPIASVVEPLKRPVAVVIRMVEPDSVLGRVVARIELLSPSNKPGGSEAAAYDDRRVETLESGVPLIEIDYLHETRSVIADVPIYSSDDGAVPYLIAVSNPRPSWEEGWVVVYGFGVDQPIATVPLPLADNDMLVFKFDEVYQHTFQARRYHNLLDYTQLPTRFHTYSAKDQVVIQQRMAEMT